MVKNLKRILTILSIPLFLLCSCSESARQFSTSQEDFSFSLTWGIGYDSTYDSKTEVLVKEKIVYERKPEEYITTYHYPNIEDVYSKIKAMNIYSYPDLFDAYQGVSMHTAPATNYILVVGDKTIEAKNCPLIDGYPEGLTAKGKKYLEVVFLIRDTIQNSEEWKALPDPEVKYL